MRTWIWHHTCHGSSCFKLPQLCPLKGPPPGLHCIMSSRAYAKAYTALYTLYSGRRFEISKNSVCTLSRFSCPLHINPPASTQPFGGGANLHWNVYSQNCFTWNIIKQHAIIMTKIGLFLQLLDQIAASSHHVICEIVIVVLVRTYLWEELPEPWYFSSADGDAECTSQVWHELGGLKHRSCCPGFTGHPLQTCHILPLHLCIITNI